MSVRWDVPTDIERSDDERRGTAHRLQYQPNLEKRHAQLKGTQLVAPMFLHDPARIEGLLCCHFIAMLLQALIERTIRTAMADRAFTELSLFPRTAAAPHPPPPASWRTSTACPATTSVTPRATSYILPTRTHRATTRSPRPTRHPRPRLHHRLMTASNWRAEASREVEGLGADGERPRKSLTPRSAQE